VECKEKRWWIRNIGQPDTPKTQMLIRKVSKWASRKATKRPQVISLLHGMEEVVILINGGLRMDWDPRQYQKKLPSHNFFNLYHPFKRTAIMMTPRHNPRETLFFQTHISSPLTRVFDLWLWVVRGRPRGRILSKRRNQGLLLKAPGHTFWIIGLPFTRLNGSCHYSLGNARSQFWKKSIGQISWGGLWMGIGIT
jgi:hypothetical protein